MMSLSTNNSLTAAAQTAGKKINAPAGFKTTADAANEALAAKSSSGMGQKDFLTLFTTQLKCQESLTLNYRKLINSSKFEPRLEEPKPL